MHGVECIIIYNQNKQKITATLKIYMKNVFMPGDLDLWPMTLTFEIDLDTDTEMHDAKTITPSTDARCNIIVATHHRPVYVIVYG